MSSRTHRFFAWFLANSSPAAVLGDLLANMFNCVGFSWEASPAATELETLVLGEGLSLRRLPISQLILEVELLMA